MIFSDKKLEDNPEFNVAIDELIGLNTTFTLQCLIRTKCDIIVELDSPSQIAFLRYHFTKNSPKTNEYEYEIVPTHVAAHLEITVFNATVSVFFVCFIFTIPTCITSENETGGYLLPQDCVLLDKLGRHHCL